MSRAKALLLLPALLLIAGHAWAGPVVMNLSVSDPFQAGLPGSVITYHYTLVNTINTDLPIFGFVFVNLPSYMTELFTGYTLPGNGTVNGTLSFQVANNATYGLQTFGMEAASTLHDPGTGLSYISTQLPASVDIVPEPSTMFFLAAGLGMLGLTAAFRRLRDLFN